MKDLAMSLFERSPESGSRLLVLMACGFLAGEDGVCRASIREIARLARIEERQCQRVLTQLAGTGVLLCEPGGGRGRPNLYRFADWPGEKGVIRDTLSNPERVSSTTGFSEKGDIHDTLSAEEKGVTHDTVYQIGVTGDTLSEPERVSSTTGFSEKGDIHDTLSAEEKGVTHDTVYQMGVTDDTLSEPERVSSTTGFSEKGDTHDTLSTEKGVAHDTLFPALTRARVEDDSSVVEEEKREEEEESSSSFSSSSSPKRLSASQAPVARFLTASREAGLPDPAMSRIATWIKTLRDSGQFADATGALIELLQERIGGGLGEAEIEKPWSYFHRCVLTHAKKKPAGRGLFPEALKAGGGGSRAGQAARLQEAARRRSGGRP